MRRLNQFELKSWSLDKTSLVGKCKPLFLWLIARLFNYMWIISEKYFRNLRFSFFSKTCSKIFSNLGYSLNCFLKSISYVDPYFRVQRKKDSTLILFLGLSRDIKPIISTFIQIEKGKMDIIPIDSLFVS